LDDLPHGGGYKGRNLCRNGQSYEPRNSDRNSHRNFTRNFGRNLCRYCDRSGSRNLTRNFDRCGYRNSYRNESNNKQSNFARSVHRSFPRNLHRNDARNLYRDLCRNGPRYDPRPRTAKHAKSGQGYSPPRHPVTKIRDTRFLALWFSRSLPADTRFLVLLLFALGRWSPSTLLLRTVRALVPSP